MKVEPVPSGTLFARLLSDIMIPPQFSAAIHAFGIILIPQVQISNRLL